MKAKEYLKQMCDPVIVAQHQVRINKVLSDMVDEMKGLAVIRHIKRDEGRFSLLKEFDNKWKVIVRLSKKESINIDLDDDGFILYVYDNVPEFSKFIRIEDPIDDTIDDISNEVSHFHKTIPLAEITDENITREILACLYAIGSYSSLGIPLPSMAPLAHRISLLRYWKENGINYEQIDEFEKDRDKFIQDIIMPAM